MVLNCTRARLESVSDTPTTDFARNGNSASHLEDTLSPSAPSLSHHCRVSSCSFVKRQSFVYQPASGSRWEALVDFSTALSAQV
eukprot:9543885-Karenia_brevis.AAC.1